MKVNLYTVKDQKLTITEYLQLGFLSFFGVGYSPKAPGTVGSLATIPVIYALSSLGISVMQLWVLISVLFIVACYITDIVQKKRGLHDPQWIVIDEVIGMLITWAFIFPRVDMISIFLAFVVFRIFDIIKIFPANWADKKITNGIGTNLDDVISALYAGLVLWNINYFHWIN
jgi:phosphatidylglycerophosphatase A